MVPNPTLALLGVLFFAGVSFFFALAEASLFSLGKWQTRQLAERAPRHGATVARLLAQPQDLLATIVLGNTFANAALLATGLWMTLHGEWLISLTVPGLLVLILVGCEVVPKTLAVRQPQRWALWVARPMWVFLRVSRPVREVAQKLNVALLALLPKAARLPSGSADAEYQELLELAHHQGALARTEKEIILQIISLDRRTVNEVMQPRSRMACIPDDLPVGEMIAAARRFKHRRLPIYDETPDTIVGVLNTRALLLDPQIDLADAIEFPSFVPESMNLLQLLKSLQLQRRGLAIVLDEYGGTAGLVTVEDILAKVLGQLHGEVETGGFVMEELGEGRWRVNGTMRLEDFRREYPDLGEVPEVDTMGGLLVHLLGLVPSPGEMATFQGLKLTAQVTDERRVRELLVEQVK